MSTIWAFDLSLKSIGEVVQQMSQSPERDFNNAIRITQPEQP
jgi:hypothetical protein